MAAFRRCVIALAVLAVFAGLASAQTAAMTCNLSSLNTTARAEGKTELVSDLLATCTGGTINLSNTTQAPTVNLTLTLPQPITSRLLVTTNSASEAMLLIDDPGTSGTGLVAGFGNNAAASLCEYTTNTSGCSAFPNVKGGIAVMTAATAPLDNLAGATSAKNVYQGVVSGNSVTFFGVPVVPPGTTASRTFRITNIRVNASAGSTGSLVGSVQVQGGAAPLFSFNQTQATLATIQSGLTVKSTPLAASNCNAGTLAYAGTVAFTENFASAFRTRVAPGTAANSGQTNALTQTIPGTYFSESGYEIATTAGNAGVADFGTRLKAVFNNIPSGVRVFVSFANMTGANSASAGTASVVYNSANVGNTLTTALAELVTSESVADTTSVAAVTPSVSTSTVVLGGGAVTGTPYVELTVSSGSATAVWEVVNTNTAGNETFTFDVWVTYPAQQPTGAATVNLSYAPLATGTVPVFGDPNAASPQSSVSITQCKTTLLFPYVTSAAGFDTGLAIANTTADPFGTVAQSGTCTFSYYGTPATTATVSPSIAAGTVYAYALSGVATGFQGYAIAVCNFQFAHGFAFVADWGNPSLSSAMGYLALIMPYSGTTAGTRGAGNGEGLLQ